MSDLHVTIHKIFHTLWTKAVGTDTYDKKEWIELERSLAELKLIERDRRHQSSLYMGKD